MFARQDGGYPGAGLGQGRLGAPTPARVPTVGEGSAAPDSGTGATAPELGHWAVGKKVSCDGRNLSFLSATVRTRTHYWRWRFSAVCSPRVCFQEVKRKSNKISRKVPLPQVARERLEAYLKSRGEALGPETPLLVSRYGNPLQPKAIYRITIHICNQANAPGNAIRLTPHMLRHTFFKRVADKQGVHVAQEMSGNISMKEVFHFTKPSQAKIDQLTENVF